MVDGVTVLLEQSSGQLCVLGATGPVFFREQEREVDGHT